MTPERWQRIQSLYESALALEAAGRAAFVERECAQDPALRAQLQALLTEDEGSDARISAVIQRTAADLVESQSAALLGKRLGPWALVRRIAQGGMGSVYLGERHDGQFEQRVAIKLLSPALLSSEALARFSGEQRILARLTHPNIARLYDGGTTDEGVPYLVMEYIEGLPIDAYCRQQGLDTRARLGLFNKVCAAVDFAHRNLVVHRDIKPSNILVDTNGEPKLLDFGVAKLIDQDQRVVEAALTQADLRMLTPRYASPEQLKGENVSTATDVYSLGVLLYELLAERFPYDKFDSSAQALHRAIVETDPPPPSSLLRKKGRSASLAGDLDNIVLMALHKDPARRYGTARDLADDLRRHLTDEPVRARRDSFLYRAGKFARRNRLAIGVAGIVTVLVAAQASFYATRLVRERDAANAARVSAEEIAGFLESIFDGANPYNSEGRVASVRDLLDAAAARIDTELEAHPAAKARLLHVIGATYSDVGAPEDGIIRLRRALEIRLQLFGRDDLRVAQTMDRLGFILERAGKTDEARPLLEQALLTRTAKLGRKSFDTAQTLARLAHLGRATGDFDAARRHLQEARVILEEIGRTEDRLYVSVLQNMGLVLGMAGDYVAEERYQHLAVEASIAAGRPRDPMVATAYGNIGTALVQQQRHAEAEPFYEKAIALKREILGPRAADLDADLTNFGRFYIDMGRLDKAEPLLLEAIDIAREHLGEQHVWYAYDLLNVARLRSAQRRYAEAESLFRQGLEIYEKAEGPDFSYLGSSRADYGRMLIEARRFADAEQVLRQSAAFYERNPRHAAHSDGFDHDARTLLGETLAQQGQFREAEPLLVNGYEGLLKTRGPDYQRTRQAFERLIAFYERQGNQAAVARYRASRDPSGTVP